MLILACVLQVSISDKISDKNFSPKKRETIMNINDLNGHFPILVAEDDPVARKILERTLIKEGHEVVSVENGRKAFELL